MDPVLEILIRVLDSDSETTYRLVVQALRNVVPPLHFHGYVQTFSPDLTTKGKDAWEQFRCCANDAASQIGCNVADVKYVVLNSISTVVWGFARRDRKTACLFH